MGLVSLLTMHYIQHIGIQQFEMLNVLSNQNTNKNSKRVQMSFDNGLWKYLMIIHSNLLTDLPK